MKHPRLLSALCLTFAILLPLVSACTPAPADPVDPVDTVDTAAPTDSADTADTPTEAETLPEEEPTEMKNQALTPIARDNIILNAYLVPLQDSVRERTLSLCRDADFDVLSHVYFAEHWTFENHTYENYKQLMADADRYGLKVMTMEMSLQNSLDLTDEQLVELAKSYADLPGFGGFFVVDEPVNPNPYARVEKALRTVCPDTLVNVNFLPRGMYPEGDYIRQLTDYGSLLTLSGTLSLDTYNFPIGEGVDEDNLFGNYEDLRVAGLRTGCNTAVYIQSVGMEGGYRRPSTSDIRYNMMAALAYGVKELKFFCFGTPPEEEGPYSEAVLGRDYEPTDLYEGVCATNKKIHAIGKTIAACDAVEVYHSRDKRDVYTAIPSGLFVQCGRTDNIILSLMKQRDGDAEYVMVVNKDINKARTITLTFSGMDTVSVVNDVTGEAEPVALEGGKLTLTLEAGDSAVICLPEGQWFPSDKETAPAAGENLALGKPFWADSSEGGGGYYLSNLFDGITTGIGSRLVSGDGSDQSVTVDLGSVTRINRIDMYPSGDGSLCGARNPATFSLSVSVDGETWKTVYSQKDTKLSRETVPVFRFDETDARYVRLTVGGLNGVVNSADIGELCVYLDDGSVPDNIPTAYIPSAEGESEDLALHKPVVSWSSTTDEPSWTCHHDYITDGSPTTGWASGMHRNGSPDSEEWIVIDLCETYVINRVALTPRAADKGYNAFPEDYQILVSVDGENYTVVKTVTGDNIPQSMSVRTLTFDPVSARYVMFKATRLTHDPADGLYMVEMTEIEVFGPTEQNQ